MENFSSLGNIEFANSFIFMYYVTYGFSSSSFDMRTTEWTKVSTEYLSRLLNISILEIDFPKVLPDRIRYDSNIDIKKLYLEFLKEAEKRGLECPNSFDNLLETDEFREWLIKMKNTPTYVREILATNFFGGQDMSYCDDEVMGFDPPVREACKLLNEKGYKTYWSSANYYDATYRLGDVIRDIYTAYILIDSSNLSDELKESLYLNGKCSFWGYAYNCDDSGKYYGIWAQITSPNMECQEISDILVKKVLDLPVLSNKNDSIVKHLIN